ncbi:MAG: DEAD/DEAH box helicase [Acidimicrobiales bacterium]
MALLDATPAKAVLWLPGAQTSPEASPELVRAAGPNSADAKRQMPELWPFVVPVLRLPAGPALDLVVALSDYRSAELVPGASVRALAAVAGLALEIVGGGRVLPGLSTDDLGRPTARWSPLGGGADTERARLLEASLPPVCRASGTDLKALAHLSTRAGSKAPAPRGTPAGHNGPSSAEVVLGALDAFVDVACRDALRKARRFPTELPGQPTKGKVAAIEAWLAALAREGPVVDADKGELVKLEGLIAEWKATVVGRGGPWRLCFRLREPDEGINVAPADREEGGTLREDEHGTVTGDDQGSTQEDADGASAHAKGTYAASNHKEDLVAAPEDRWHVDLLLQATDDLSLLIEANEVWRSGTTLRRAARSLEAPHEVLLAELGRARCAYPELSAALSEPAPTAVETDLAGAYRFLSEVAPALEVAGFGVLLPAWWRHPSSHLGLRLRARSQSVHGSAGRAGNALLSGGSLATVNWQAVLGDQKLTMAELAELARLKTPLVRVRGKWVELQPGEAKKLAEWLRSVGGGHPGSTSSAMSVADVLRAAAGEVQGLSGVPVLAVEANGVLGALLRGELKDRVRVSATPAGFAGRLRPYQQRGVAWLQLLERTGLGACLADDMGLGKTAMVLALLQAERTGGQPPVGGGEAGYDKGASPSGAPLGPTLIVCPTSVVGNWQREAEKFTPDLKVAVHHGTGRAGANSFTEWAAGADMVITSYSLLDRDREALAGVKWSRLVFDEAQNVKNTEAKQTKAARSLQAARRLALTGTPVENHLGELWSIMEILNPGLLGPASTFRERFAVPIERYRDEDAAERLRKLTRPFVLRRLKTDRTVIADLPEKLEMKVFCNLTREQATLYKAVVDEMLQCIDAADGMERRGLVLATMLRLKQVCNHPAQYLGDGSSLGARSGKLERTVEMLDEVLQEGERALIFTQFAEMGFMLRSHLSQRLGCQVAFLHGGVPRKQRDLMVERFQGDDGFPLMVVSLKAGGTGLNLTAANHVVHFDRWWNPAVEDQATDRAFRIGQRHNVQVRKLICAGTLEDRVDQMIDAKRQLAERIVGVGESWLTELSTSELADVFRLSNEALGAQ